RVLKFRGRGAVLQLVLQLRRRGLGEVSGDLRVAAGDRAVDFRRGDDVPVQDDREGVQPVVAALLVAVGSGVVLVVQVRGQGGKGSCSLAVKRQLDLPLVVRRRQLGCSAADLRTLHLGYVQGVLVATGVA